MVCEGAIESGSAVVASVGGVDGNSHSVAGAFWYDSGDNRAVAVDTAALWEALIVVYGAKGLLTELSTPVG